MTASSKKPAHKGLRYNTGKRRYDLIPPEWEAALADILTKGAEKYAARNWEQGLSYADTVGCLRRHLAKWQAGEQFDEGETGCHHMGMVAWNALVLMTFDLRGIGTDDMPKLRADILKAVNNGSGKPYVPPKKSKRKGR